MKRPVWAIIVGIIMLLFGGCGGINRATELMLPNINDIVNESMNGAKIKIEDDTYQDANDTLKQKEPVKIKDLSDGDKKALEMLSDSIILDGDNNVDMESTIKESFYISEYRQTWIKRFAYMGLLIAVLFLIGGIMLLGAKKYTIPVVLTALVLSLAANIFQIVIYTADKDSGYFMNSWGNIGFYVSLAFDMLLIILVMVLDKSYFGPTVVIEDYYD